MSLLGRLKRALGLSAEEDPLKREIEEMRAAARKSIKRSKRVERSLRVKRGGKQALGKRKPEERAGLLRAAEEFELLFSEQLGQE